MPKPTPPPSALPAPAVRAAAQVLCDTATVNAERAENSRLRRQLADAITVGGSR